VSASFGARFTEAQITNSDLSAASARLLDAVDSAHPQPADVLLDVRAGMTPPVHSRSADSRAPCGSRGQRVRGVGAGRPEETRAPTAYRELATPRCSSTEDRLKALCDTYHAHVSSPSRLDRRRSRGLEAAWTPTLAVLDTIAHWALIHPWQ